MNIGLILKYTGDRIAARVAFCDALEMEPTNELALALLREHDFNPDVAAESLDDEIDMESLEACTLHDIIAPPGYQGHESDPSEEAARNIDWTEYLASHPPRHRTAILVLVAGGNMREAGKRCGLKDSAAASLKRRIAGDLLEFFGLDVIRRLLGGCRPDWESDLRMTRERHLHLCDVGCGLDAAKPVPC